MTDRISPSARRVLDFWTKELTQEDWYRGGPELDARIRDRFLPLWEEAVEGGLGLWLTDPEGALAYIILTDQMPRNMFRGEARSFATDPMALAAAREALARDIDRAIAGPEREFFYMPFEHSEDPADQDLAVAYFTHRMPDAEKLLHAQAHRAIIRRFGRFPTRNAALGRESTPAEAQWIAGGGYMAAVAQLRAGGAAEFPA